MFSGVYEGKTVLVTGNTGFKGAWLSLWLRQLGAQVVGLSDEIPTRPSLFEAVGLDREVRYIQADVRDSERVRAVIQEVQPDFIFHLAAQALVRESYHDPLRTISTNVMGTANVLAALRDAKKPCQVVAITSDKCYENKEWVWGYRETDRLGGKDPYSASKAAAEICARAFFYSYFSSPDQPVRMATARAGNVIGGGDWAKDRLVPDAIRAWADERAIEVRNPRSTRPWQHVLEPLSGYLSLGAALAQGSELIGMSFNFGPLPDQDKSVVDLLQLLAANWEFSKKFEPVTFRHEDKMHEANLLKLACDLAQDKLKWQAVLNVEQTARFTANWYLAFYRNRQGILDVTHSQLAAYCQAANKKGLAWAL